MAMTDDERIIEAVGKAWANWNATGGMADLVNRILMYGITLTIEPAPEPTVALPPMTCKQVDMLFTAIQDGERWENRAEGFDAWFELNALVNRARCTPEER